MWLDLNKQFHPVSFPNGEPGKNDRTTNSNLLGTVSTAARNENEKNLNPFVAGKKFALLRSHLYNFGSDHWKIPLLRHCEDIVSVNSPKRGQASLSVDCCLREKVLSLF